MHRRSWSLALRIALVVALVSVLSGCFCGDPSLHESPFPNDPSPTSTALCDGTFTPERIEILDMNDRSIIDEGGTLHIAFGGQGSQMVGLYVAVYGDDIPDCLPTAVHLDGYGDNADDFNLVDGGPRRAETEAPIYWIMDGLETPGPSTISVTIGDMTVEQSVTVDY